MIKKKKILLHAWTLHKNNNNYYIPYTHWVYLQEIVKYYDTICLLSPVNKELVDSSKYECIDSFSNVTVYELPYSNGYIESIPYFLTYLKAYKYLSKTYNEVYARYPTPFCWLQMIFFTNKRKIIHYVGDPIDTILNNPNLSFFKKKFYTFFFKPENWLIRKASLRSEVYTNGFHLANNLSKFGIKPKALISSTLKDEDFHFGDKKNVTMSPKLIYVGYLRKAKGVDTVIKSFDIIQKYYPNASLKIVGDGEMKDDLSDLVKSLALNNVEFLGHIDNRDILNSTLRDSNIFVFASLSEGSPRVVLEAMANGLAVVSTPVGSLPTTFKADLEILFANFNDHEDFANKLLKLINSSVIYEEIRTNSYKKVLDYKIENFIKKIFHEA